MIEKLNTISRYSERLRAVSLTIFLGIGGTGRECVRAAARQIEAHFGCPVPHVLIVEMDLCGETGRSLEAPFQPILPGTYMTYIAPGVNCAAAVEQYGGNPDHELWEAVDPAVIGHVVDTGEIGALASPQVARFASEFNKKQLDDFCMRVATRAETMRHTEVPGWELVGPVQLVVMRSLNGAVGSAGLHVVDRLRNLLRPPYRVIDMPALLADRGRVTNRNDARALQQCAMAEILNRSL